MKQWLLGCGLCVVLGSAAAQQVWRCEEDGVVRYTDQPCEAQGRPVLAASAASAVPAPAVAADRSAKRRTADARSRQRDAWAPMPAGFVQRGHPRAQTLAALPTPTPVSTP